MDPISALIDLLLHLDEYLVELIKSYGIWTYVILFIVVFCETGLVVAPFLPGDSLLFAAGALAALGAFEIATLLFVFAVAAILGDTVNYWMGYYLGPRIFEKDRIWPLKKEYLDRAKIFYAKHGGKTIVLARFIPVVRTFAPFVAGMGVMDYKKFLIYNVVGGMVWVTMFLGLGFWFGNLPAIKGNFGLVLVAIIVISFIPFIYEFARTRLIRHRKAI